MARVKKPTTKNGPPIKYKDGYKYQLVEQWKCILKGYSFSINRKKKRRLAFLEFRLVENSDVDPTCCLMENSENNSEIPIYSLIIRRGYAWDGVSYASDPPEAMRGSLVHDALYQLMREKVLKNEKDRAVADKILRDFFKRDGMGNWAELPYAIVRNLGADFASPSARRRVHTAPLQKSGSDDTEQEQSRRMIANQKYDPRIKYTERCNYQLHKEWKCILKGYSFPSQPKRYQSDFLEFGPAKNRTKGPTYWEMKNSDKNSGNSTYYLIIKAGYGWDLCSGGLETPSGMRGSLVHDALYQLMRKKILSTDEDRKTADKVLRDFCKRDRLIDPEEMYNSVRAGGQGHARPKKVYKAPPESQESGDSDEVEW